jgi:hypothetical protein
MERTISTSMSLAVVCFILVDEKESENNIFFSNEGNNSL